MLYGMQITTATFIKSILGTDEILEQDKPQIALVGRSNVGKSSLINSLTGLKNLARSSGKPGSTTMINLFLINKSHYLVDLPGYGYARGSRDAKDKLQDTLLWYIFRSPHPKKKIVLIIDAEVGFTDNDLGILYTLDEQEQDVVIVANKVDKIKKSLYDQQLKKIQSQAGEYQVIAHSSETGVGREALRELLFGKD
jgi:GTP-binding protein